MQLLSYQNVTRDPWHKGKIVGQKSPLKLQEVWAIRIRLQIKRDLRELTLFNLAIDSKLRGYDLVRLRVRDVLHGQSILKRALIMQQKTQQPVQFEIRQQTREAIKEWIEYKRLPSHDYLFPSRIVHDDHLSTRQYARIVDSWIHAIGLDPAAYGTHSMRRTKASLIYKRTKNLRAVFLVTLCYMKIFDYSFAIY